MSFALVHQNKNKGDNDKTPTFSKYSHTLVKRSNDYFNRLQTIGNQTASPTNHTSGFDFAKIGIQPKLKVSQPNDPYEQEADKIADQVMRTSMDDFVQSSISKNDEKIINIYKIDSGGF